MLLRLLIAGLLALALLAVPLTAQACPMCKETASGNERLAAMYNWSILALVSLPFSLVAVIAARTMRSLDPAAYLALKKRLLALLWPRGWAYVAAGAAAVFILFYATTPPDPATRLRLPAEALARQPALSAGAPLPPLEGRVVVVTFFASWCPPCVEQLVDLAGLQAEFESRGVAFIALNAFEADLTPAGIPHLHADGTLEFHAGAPDLPAFLEANQIGLPVLESTPALSAAFGTVARIPTTLVFDAQGRLVRRYTNEARGSFIRPQAEALRRDVRAALACGGLSLRLAREACLWAAP